MTVGRPMFWLWRWVLGEPVNVIIYRRALAGDNGLTVGRSDTQELQQLARLWAKRFIDTCWMQMTVAQQQYVHWRGLPTPPEIR